jgi:antitoxin component YwqK of YwqJK toxin-antitoxin module
LGVLVAGGCKEQHQTDSLSTDNSIVKKEKENYNLTLLKQDRFENEDFEIREVNDSYGLRYYINSKNYEVFNSFFKNGMTDVEFVRNKNLQIEEEKWYYENGQIKQAGAKTYPNGIFIGQWKYFSQNGHLDSIADYDKKNKISYIQAIEIAKEQGFTLPECEVDFTAEKAKAFWTILRWTVDQDKRGSTGQGIKIDAQTGKVTKAQPYHGVF